MFTLSDISSHIDAPRRTVQYWADQNVLRAELIEGRKRLTYGMIDLEVAAMLRPFLAIGLPIAGMKLLATIFRGCMLDEECRSTEEAGQFGPAIAAARQGDPSFLIVIFYHPEVTAAAGEFRANVWTATTRKEAKELAIDAVSRHSACPVLVIDLRQALYPIQGLRTEGGS